MGNVDKIRGTVFGLAYGDAWGWPTEFMEYPNILAHGKFSFPANAIITDDTQMSLYAIKPVFANPELFADKYIDETKIRLAFADSFLVWLNDPKNDRAPGITCVNALVAYANSARITGFEGSNQHSKGCGANMRNPWFGLLPYDDRRIELLSVIQASVTHSHPLALASAAVTALLVKALYQETVPEGETLFNYARNLTESLIQINNASFYDAQYNEGLQELRDFFASKQYEVEEYLKTPTSGEYDICEILGLGKVAEEALLLAVAATDKYSDDPIAGLERLVHSSGDSDSIAAIGGAFLGAKYGNSIWPSSWKTQLEDDYEVQLEQVVANLS